MIRRLAIVLLAVSFLSGAAAPPLASPPTVMAASGPLAILVDAVNSVVQQVEQSARSLMEQGNVSLAQQQMTLAGSLRALISQVEKTYADSLQKTADQLTIQEKNLRQDLETLVRSLQGSVKLTSAELQSRIYQTQTSANQLLDKALPLSSRAPLVYAVQTRDILQAFSANPADVEVLGYLLTDPELQHEKPAVTIDGEVIPSDRITALQDRLQIQIPEGLKTKIRLQNLPCEPMKTFAVAMRVRYLSKGGWFSWLWKLLGRAETANLSALAAPGARAYDVVVQVDGVRNQDDEARHDFGVASGQVNFGCEETRATLATWSAPAGSFNMNIETCAWRNMANVKSHAATPSLGGLTATCSGSITGLDYRNYGFVRDCPGGGHGEVYLAGKYSTTQHSQIPYAFKNGATFAGSQLDFTLPMETGLAYKTLRVEVRRKGCPALLDELSMEVPADPNERKLQGSKNGLFKISLQRAALEVVGTELLAANK